MLDLEEVKASGEAPRDELYAPVVGGRDFVSERLEIEKRMLEARSGFAPNRIERQLKKVRLRPHPPRANWTTFQASLASKRRGSGTSRTV